MRDWDKHFMEVAKLNASMATCRTRHVGAVATIGRRQLAAGFNGNLSGALHCDEGGCERCNDPNTVSGYGLERCVCVHAEQALVGWCARNGVALEGATIYLTCHPCSDCYKLMASAGVAEIVYSEPYVENGTNWFHYMPDSITMRCIGKIDD